MRLPRMLTIVSLVVAACDGSSSNNPDASTTPDPPPLPLGCDFAELADASNDDLSELGTAEVTGLTFATASTICGTIDTGHFDALNEVVDIDSYTFAIGEPSQLLVHLTGGGAEALALVAVLVFDADNKIVASGIFHGTHLVFNASLAAGSYTLTMGAINDAAISTPIAYKLGLVADDPLARCGTITAAAQATESNDGAEHAGNDMVDVRFGGASELRRVLTAADDAPEATGVTTAVGMKYRFTGSNASVNAADAYMDRDAFLIKTGVETNQLSIRVDWGGSTVDIDFMLFPVTGMPREIASAIAIGNSGPEFATFAVVPDTEYWLWIASYDGSTGLPITYDASVCAERFAP